MSNIDVDVVLEMIDKLRKLVQQSKDPEVKKIAIGLKELQKLLQRQELSGKDLGELLTEIGDRTSQIAVEAKMGLQGPLQNLGKKLIKVGLFLCNAED